MRENIASDLGIEILARKAGMSQRSLTRAFVRIFQKSPAKFVESIRIEAAISGLLAGKLSVKAIADRCGFQSYERMRRAFHRKFGISPLEYQVQFAEPEEMSLGIHTINRDSIFRQGV